MGHGGFFAGDVCHSVIQGLGICPSKPASAVMCSQCQPEHITRSNCLCARPLCEQPKAAKKEKKPAADKPVAAAK